MTCGAGVLGYLNLESDDFRSATRGLNASWYEGRFFQLLKSVAEVGMKYARISRAESFPVSESKHSQSRGVSRRAESRRLAGLLPRPDSGGAAVPHMALVA